MRPFMELPALTVSVIYAGIPFAAALATRAFFVVIRAQHFFEHRFLPAIAPLSLIALLFTILIIFAGQGHQVVDSIVDVVRVGAPLIVYFIVMFFSILYLCRYLRVSYRRSTTQAFTAASNNFELSTAVAVAVWGAKSPQALATTVGPLIEYAPFPLLSSPQADSPPLSQSTSPVRSRLPSCVHPKTDAVGHRSRRRIGRGPARRPRPGGRLS